jgi:hypothetical protein
MTEIHDRLTNEFDRQLRNLVELGIARLAGVSEPRFCREIQLLRSGLEAIGKAGSLPFVIVVKNVLPEAAIVFAGRNGKQGFTTMEAEDLRRFRPIEGVVVPAGFAYLLADVDTGESTLNVTSGDALPAIRAAGRSPLTLEEGVAIVIQDPDSLRANGFSMLGSRCGDRRVTALWLSAGRPRLGWGWAGNPHTWLGSASCGGRAGAERPNLSPKKPAILWTARAARLTASHSVSIG